MQVLMVESDMGKVPESVTTLARDFGWKIHKTSSYQDAIDAAQSSHLDAAFVAEPVHGGADDPSTTDFERLLGQMEGRRIATIVIGNADNDFNKRSVFDVVDPKVTSAELQGRFAMIERYHGHLQHLESELSRVEKLSRDLASRFEEVEQELQLASRLQRDFLPDLSQPFHNVQFSAHFEPASWVSGDMFDVFAINEHCTGFYLCDAVGHGMAASLLTMFVRRVFAPEQTRLQNTTTLLEPSVALARLNESLTDQNLPHCQFVTACYGVLDHRTMKLRLARGGHPYPLHCSRDREIREIRSRGGLLGVFPDESYETAETQLLPGDKVLLFTDGAELGFGSGDRNQDPVLELHRTVESLSDRPLEEMITRFESMAAERSKGLAVRDDVTLVGLEVLR